MFRDAPNRNGWVNDGQGSSLFIEVHASTHRRHARPGDYMQDLKRGHPPQVTRREEMWCWRVHSDRMACRRRNRPLAVIEPRSNGMYRVRFFQTTKIQSMTVRRFPEAVRTVAQNHPALRAGFADDNFETPTPDSPKL